MLVLPVLLHLFIFVSCLLYIVISVKDFAIEDTTSDTTWASRVSRTMEFVHQGNPVMQSDIDAVLDKYNFMYPMVDDIHDTLYITTIYHFFLFLTFGTAGFRLLQHLNFQHLLNTLTEGFRSVLSDLVHTMLLLFVLICGFAIGGWLLLSQYSEEYQTLLDAIKVTLQIACGMHTIEKIAQQRGGMPIFIYNLSVKFIVVIVAFKAILAIIIVAYKAQLKAHDSAMRTIRQDFHLYLYIVRDSILASCGLQPAYVPPYGLMQLLRAQMDAVETSKAKKKEKVDKGAAKGVEVELKQAKDKDGRGPARKEMRNHKMNREEGGESILHPHLLRYLNPKVLLP